MKDVLSALKKENRRLSQLAELDWLTGLYNRMATENKVNEFLRTKKSGVLFVIDVDNFKMVNDRYGHVAGDSVLRGVAEILSNMTLRGDILGRIGGDEFVIFMPISQETEFIASRCRQIETRFRDLSSARLVVSRLSLTVCGSGYQPGDNYSRLFDRADQCLIKEKEERRKRQRTTASRTFYPGEDSGLKMDMEQISRELSEKRKAEGAFCQDYESFLSIYRFMERRLKRVQSSVYSILITLTNNQGEFLSLQEREEPLEVLYQVIQQSLRSGDVFTRYSSSQFLLMVSDVTACQADAIAERIRGKFYRKAHADGRYSLQYGRYPLKQTSD